MSRTLHGRAVWKGVKGVLVVAGDQTPSRTFLPSFLSSISPCLRFPSPLIQFVSRRHLHLVSPQSCYRPLFVTSYTFLLSPPPPPIPPALLSAPLSTSPLARKIREKVDGENPVKSKKKQYTSPFITLIDTEDKISKMGLDQAERLARRRDLKLVKVEDPSLTKGSKDVYRLLTGKQYFEEQVKAKRSGKKSQADTKDEKILTIGGNITLHDLTFKLHSVSKWLNKGHQIKVTITGKKSTKENREKIFSVIEEEVKKHNSRILQRQEKIDDIRFYIAPPKVKEENTTNKETTQEDDCTSLDESKSDKT